MAERDDLRDALERLSDGFVAVDTDWRITYCNAAAADLFSAADAGDGPGEPDRQAAARADVGATVTDTLVGRVLWDVVSPPVESALRNPAETAASTGEATTAEVRPAPLDGCIDVRLHPSDTGLSLVLSAATHGRTRPDVLATRERVLREMYEIIADRTRPFTEQVEALLALGRAELDTAYGTLSRIEGDDYVFEVVDADDDSIEAGDVVPLSATNCEIAASREETLVLGDVGRDAPDQTDRAGYTDWGISCYVGGPVFVDDEVYGTFCFYDTEARSDQFSDWEVTLVDLMSRWVSYELQRKRATDRLRQQNDTLEEFASVVSHDLRGPLEVIRGSVELARRTDDLTHLDRCETAIERMETLIDDLLTMARAGLAIDETTAVDLRTQVTQCWQTLATADATLDVVTDSTVRADESRLRQLLENLVRNAVDHGGPDVTITVGDLADGFYVEDDGPGIPAAERDRVFEHGYSTTDDGTGFGLAIVAEIADAHGWTVSVTESEAGGARFEVAGVERVGAGGGNGN